MLNKVQNKRLVKDFEELQNSLNKLENTIKEIATQNKQEHIYIEIKFDKYKYKYDTRNSKQGMIKWEL